MAIDIGSPAINRNNPLDYPGYTFILKDNPASAPTTITQIQIFPYGGYDITGVKVGIFYITNGNTLKCRAVADIGTVTANQTRQYFDVSLAVQAGDYLGYHHDTQPITMTGAGFPGLWYTASDTCIVDDETTYSAVGNYTISVYGTDTPEGVEDQLVSNGGVSIYGGWVTRVGQRLFIPNRTIESLSFFLGFVNSPTGDITYTIRKVSDDSDIIASKVLCDAGSLEGLPHFYPLELTTPVTVNEEVRIQAEFSGGDSSNYIQVWRQSTDVKADECFTYYFSSPADTATYDCAYAYLYTIPPVAGIGAFYQQLSPLGINIYRAGRSR